MEEKIEDMAKGGTLTNENVGILLQTFVDSLIEDTQNKKGNRSKRGKANTNRGKAIHNKKKEIPICQAPGTIQKMPTKVTGLGIIGRAE